MSEMGDEVFRLVERLRPAVRASGGDVKLVRVDPEAGVAVLRVLRDETVDDERAAAIRETSELMLLGRVEGLKRLDWE